MDFEKTRVEALPKPVGYTHNMLMRSARLASFIAVVIALLCPIHTADADETQLSSWVASAVCTEFATIVADSFDEPGQIFAGSEIGSRRPAVYISCAVEPIIVRLLRLVTSNDTMTSLLKKLSISIKIHAMFSFQIVNRIRRQSSWTSCEFIHDTPLTPRERWICGSGQCRSGHIGTMWQGWTLREWTMQEWSNRQYGYWVVIIGYFNNRLMDFNRLFVAALMGNLNT